MQNKESQRLRECPFCGDDRPAIKTKMYKELGFLYTRVECQACGASIRGYLEEERAIHEWNRRTTVATNIYDKEETYPNCTVQVLTNTATGETSVGWWENGGNEDA